MNACEKDRGNPEQPLKSEGAEDRGGKDSQKRLEPEKQRGLHLADAAPANMARPKRGERVLADMLGDRISCHDRAQTKLANRFAANIIFRQVAGKNFKPAEARGD